MPPHALRKWSIVAAFWTVQAAAAYAALVAWYVSATGVNGPAGTLWGPVSWTDFVETAAARNVLLPSLALIGTITALQAVFLIPVRRPTPAGAPGWPVTVSLTIAGLAAAALAVAAVIVLIELGSVFDVEPFRSLDFHWFLWFLALWALMVWALATPLLMAFCRRGRRGTREGTLSRAASILFIGTVVETAAIMPIDVMIRRRTDCYCGGAYFGLILCAGVGLFALGPAVLLPILARRRKRWHAGRCDACGYDMTGCPTADRCPECGAGWRPSTRC